MSAHMHAEKSQRRLAKALFTIIGLSFAIPVAALSDPLPPESATAPPSSPVAPVKTSDSGPKRPRPEIGSVGRPKTQAARRPASATAESQPEEIRPKAPRAAQRAGTSASPETAAGTRQATRLYRQYCLRCHGSSGSGSETKASMAAIPDFTSRAWQEGLREADLVVSILDGKGTLMPA